VRLFFFPDYMGWDGSRCGFQARKTVAGPFHRTQEQFEDYDDRFAGVRSKRAGTAAWQLLEDGFRRMTGWN
jgi:hypothetical protein